MIEIAKRKFGHAHQYEWRSSAPASKKCCDATITGPKSRSLPAMGTATAKRRLPIRAKTIVTIGPSYLAPSVDPWGRSSHPL
jgi:hypothetical protein